MSEKTVSALDRVQEPRLVVLDGNCVSYWLDGLEATKEPAAQDKERDQKIALVRMFFYWPRDILSVVARGRDEIEVMKNLERLHKHQAYMDVLLTELPRLPDEAVKSKTDQLHAEGVNAKDSIWLAEALAHQVPVALTWDHDLLKETDTRHDINVMAPTQAWDTWPIPPGVPPSRIPASSNPLSGENWWRI